MLNKLFFSTNSNNPATSNYAPPVGQGSSSSFSGNVTLALDTQRRVTSGVETTPCLEFRLVSRQGFGRHPLLGQLPCSSPEVSTQSTPDVAITSQKPDETNQGTPQLPDEPCLGNEPTPTPPMYSNESIALITGLSCGAALGSAGAACFIADQITKAKSPEIGAVKRGVHWLVAGVTTVGVVAITASLSTTISPSVGIAGTGGFVAGAAVKVGCNIYKRYCGSSSDADAPERRAMIASNANKGKEETQV